MNLHWGIAILLLAAVGCTDQSASEPARIVFTSEQHGGVTIILHEEPLKLKEVPITVTLDSASHREAASHLVARIDMPEMPMNVAPVTLHRGDDGVYEGTLVFTMSGPWFVDIAADGSKPWSVRHDVRVP